MIAAVTVSANPPLLSRMSTAMDYVYVRRTSAIAHLRYANKA